ncbi:MAG: hypothetical protein DRP64_02180, partial [Verrucomicrobia bacterium]
MKTGKYLALSVFLAAGVAQAATIQWTGTWDFGSSNPPGDSSWSNPNSWNENGVNTPGAPAAGDTAIIQKYFWGDPGLDSGVSPVLDVATPVLGDVYVADADSGIGGGQIGELNLVGGANLSANNLLMAQPVGSTATVNMSGNAAVTVGGFFNGAADATINMSGTSTLDITITMVDQEGGTWGITIAGDAVLNFAGGLPEYANNEITALDPSKEIRATFISGATWRYTVTVPFPDPWVLQMAVNGSDLDFDWNTRSGKLYDLESTESLTDPSWEPYDDGVSVHANIPASGWGINTLSSVKAVGPIRFFRIKELEWERPMIDILTGNHLYNPHIIQEPGEEYEFKMWFFGWVHADCNPGYSGCDAIFHARSNDLDNWEVWTGTGWDATGNTALWAPVIVGDSVYFDQDHSGDPSVVKKDGTYYMAYSTTGNDLDGYVWGDPNDTDKMISVVRFATSPNGIDWTKSTLPVLMNDDEIGEPEVTYLDDPETPEDESTIVIPDYTGQFHRPTLMWDVDHWRIWFDYWAPSPIGTSLGHAECYGDPMVRSNW